LEKRICFAKHVFLASVTTKVALGRQAGLSRRKRIMNAERRGRRPSAANQSINQLPWCQPQLALEPARLLSDDQIEAIHRLSLQVLEEIGMDMLHPEAREILARAGACVDGE